jgi:PleD family two-component response regulator
MHTSIGVVSTIEIKDGIDALIQAADEALYTAKNCGKDCIIFRDMQSLEK